MASGLNLASTIGEHWFSLHLLLEWLAGVSGTSVYQKELSKIVKIIIAGGFCINTNIIKCFTNFQKHKCYVFFIFI